jgi:hypothetical protein
VGGMRFGEAVGRIGEDSVMVVRVHQLVDHVGGRFELGVFVVGGHFEQVHILSGVTFNHVLVIIGKEIAHVIILFWCETVSQSDEFEDLPTGTASL